MSIVDYVVLALVFTDAACVALAGQPMVPWGHDVVIALRAGSAASLAFLRARGRKPEEALCARVAHR